MITIYNVKKGTKLYIEGALQTRKWTSNDGSEKYATEVVLQGFNAVLQILDGRKSSNNNANYDENNIDEELDVDMSEDFIDEKSDDDIPF